MFMFYIYFHVFTFVQCFIYYLFYLFISYLFGMNNNKRYGETCRFTGKLSLTRQIVKNISDDKKLTGCKNLLFLLLFFFVERRYYNVYNINN